MLLRLVAVVSLTLAAGGLYAEESLTQKVAMTNMADAESVYELALWCKDKRKHSLYRRYMNKVIDINSDHEEARIALGYIYYRNKWTHKSRVPKSEWAAPDGDSGSSGGDSRGPDELRKATGKAPTREEIKWDLTLPIDGAPEHANWVMDNVNIMNTSGNDSKDMEIAYRTLLREDYFPSAVCQLAKAMLRKDFKDLFGAAMMISELQRQRDYERLDQMKKLLPFMITCSERVTNGEDLSAFASVAAMINDRRAVPTLIHILSIGNEDAQYGAKAALSNITLIPENDITAAVATDWWKKYHNASDEVVYTEAVQSRDLDKVIKGCEKLIPKGYRLAIPNLIRVVEKGNVRQYLQADGMLKILTGSSWVDMNMSDAVKEKKVELLKNWWKDNAATFEPPIVVKMRNEAMRRAATQERKTGATDGLAQRIAKLASMEAIEASGAERFLVSQGDKAVPTLIKIGLTHSNGIVRDKVAKVLRQITKQNFGFKGLIGTDTEREIAREKWVQWAQAKGQIADPKAEEKSEEPEEPKVPVKKLPF